jgi:hypothetical protein
LNSNWTELISTILNCYYTLVHNRVIAHWMYNITIYQLVWMITLTKRELLSPVGIIIITYLFLQTWPDSILHWRVIALVLVMTFIKIYVVNIWRKIPFFSETIKSRCFMFDKEHTLIFTCVGNISRVSDLGSSWPSCLILWTYVTDLSLDKNCLQ